MIDSRHPPCRAAWPSLLAGCAVAAVAAWLAGRATRCWRWSARSAAGGPGALAYAALPRRCSPAAARPPCWAAPGGCSAQRPWWRCRRLGRCWRLPAARCPAACARFAEPACPRSPAASLVAASSGWRLGAAVTGPALADASGTAAGHRVPSSTGSPVPDRATGSAPTRPTRPAPAPIVGSARATRSGRSRAGLLPAAPTTPASPRRGTACTAPTSPGSATTRT